MNNNILTCRIFKCITKLKMANVCFNEIENYIEEFKLNIKSIQNVFHFGTSYIILKVSRKKPRIEAGGVWAEERREKNARNRDMVESDKEGQK